jgi:hypothetical protein
MRMLSLLALLAFAMPSWAQWKLDDQFKVLKPEDLKDHESTPAPSGALVLFDGKSTSNWTKRDGKPVEWKLANGAMEGFKGHGDIVTKDKFEGKFKLHVEFRIPYEPTLKQGQGRGNSGVYVQGRYEVQVLDSYGIESKNNDCAAIYEVAAPLKNVCKAPTVWQAYDIEFTSPKFDGTKKVEPVRMTVYHNGVKVHDDLKVSSDNTRAGMGGDPSKPGPILLQDHGHPVQYRNIWLLKQ